LKLVGLTGGIASGKSTVAKLFAKLGAQVIDADQVSKDVCRPGRPAIDAIRAEFGDAVIDKNGGLDREAIREVVFSDTQKLKNLEAIVHPFIYQEIGEWMQRSIAMGADVAVIEATLIIESPPPVPLHALVVVSCDEKIRIARIKNRDGFNETQIQNVLDNQMTDLQRESHADFIIRNEGDLELTTRKVQQVMDALVSD
jgi:dephospho-CoA kinase